MKKIQTLIIIHKHPHILLGMKKRGFGMGKWNGFGGKVEKGEEVVEAAKRELFEEVGIEVADMCLIGILEFEWQNKKFSDDILKVHIFRANNYKGEPCESEEMLPKWFHTDEIPYHKMWSDDKHWMPLFLDEKKFRGKFLFDKNNNILNYELHTKNLT